MEMIGRRFNRWLADIPPICPLLSTSGSRICRYCISNMYSTAARRLGMRIYEPTLLERHDLVEDGVVVTLYS